MTKPVATVADPFRPGLAGDGYRVDPCERRQGKAVMLGGGQYRALIEGRMLHDGLPRHQRQQMHHDSREIRAAIGLARADAVQLGVEGRVSTPRIDQQAEGVDPAKVIDAGKANLTDAVRSTAGGFDIKRNKAILADRGGNLRRQHRLKPRPATGAVCRGADAADPR